MNANKPRKKDEDHYKKYQHAYYLKKKAEHKALQEQVKSTDKSMMDYVKTLLKLLNNSVSDNDVYDRLYDKFVILKGEPDDTWTDQQKLDWYKALILHLLSH